MFKSTYSYPMPTDTCSVSDIVRVNLFTKLDDCKVNKNKFIYDKCGKHLKCKIDDKTMNELKKCFKFEIDDETKNELKENIKNELEKGLKFEISDKTKNEPKENIKNELNKELDTNDKLKKGEGQEQDNIYFSDSESMAFPHYSESNDLI